MTAVDSQRAAPAERTDRVGSNEPRTRVGTTFARRHARVGFGLPPGWPIWVAVAGFPLAWALGITPLLFPLMAIPVAWHLIRSGGVRFPPGFGLWAMFLLWVVASGATLNLTAPGTLPPSGSGRYFAFALRFVDYVSVTLFMLYVGNMPERRFTQRSVMSAISVLCVQIIGLGVLAVAVPHASFRAILAPIVPSALISDAGGNPGVLQLSQLQGLLGYVAPRPAAPFTYTNAWGNSLSLALLWLVVVWFVGGSPRSRVFVVLLGVISVVPIVSSLNRGLWVGLVLSLGYIIVRLALRGRLALLGVGAVAVAVGVGIALVTPIGSTIEARINNGNSNEVRGALAGNSIEAVKASPVLGYGSTRQTQGSASSIAVGKTANCPKCGNRNIGSTGQLWLLLIAQGAVGTALYFAFFVRVLFAYRRDRSPIGMAASLTILLSFFYALFYTALLIPLCITMLAVALVWRNQDVRRDELAAIANAGSQRWRRSS